MKVLFFPFYAVTPHIETDLELIADHLDAGDDIHVVVCKGELETCYNNLGHNRSICILCKSRVLQGLKLLNFPKKNIIFLPKTKPNYENLPKTFQNVKELMNYEIDGKRLGLAAASTLITTHQKDHDFNTIKYNADVQKELHTVYFLYRAFDKLLAELKPDRFYFFNGRLSEPRAIMIACEKNKTEFVIHERSGKKGGYITRKNTFPHNIYLVQKEIEELWNNADPVEREKISREWFEERRAGVEQSWYSFVNQQEKGKLPEKFDKSKKNIIIYNSTMEEYYTIPEFQNNFLYENEIDGIENIIKDLQDEADYHVYLRIHPNLRNLDNTQNRSYRDLAAKYPKNFTLIPAESQIHSYALLDNANIVIVFGSNVGLEACYNKKPVILGCESAYDKLNVAYMPKTHQELIDLVKSDLKPKNPDNALKYAYWEKSYGIPFKRFTQSELDYGLFLGIRNEPSKIAYLIAAFYKLFEVRTLRLLLEMIKKQ